MAPPLWFENGCSTSSRRSSVDIESVSPLSRLFTREITLRSGLELTV